ncbi:Maintenance of ploidy protein mob1 [Aspergillus pseudonomiae]
MSVPITPVLVSSTTTPATPFAPPSFSKSSHPLPRPLSPSIHYNDAPLTQPPSYLSPIVRALTDETCGLTPPSNARTRAPFKPRSAAKGTSSYQLRQFAEATLGSGSLRKAVILPEGEDLNEWLAVNDSEHFKRPTKMSAPEYIEHLMSWVQSNIDNEQMFPSRLGVPFPKAFTSLIRQIFKRLYRVYAHIYCHHYPVIVHLGLEPHLNTSFKHYVLFIDEHRLASGKDFWGPLGDLVESMLRSD